MIIPKLRINADQLEALRAKGITATPMPSPGKPAPWMQRHKFNAKRVVIDGRNYGSKAEAQYAEYLKIKQQTGDLVFFLWQVPFYVPGDPRAIRLVLDFVEFWADGAIFFTDCKGMILDSFKIKRRAVQAIYPIKIRTVKMLKSGPRYDDED